MTETKDMICLNCKKFDIDRRICLNDNSNVKPESYCSNWEEATEDIKKRENLDKIKSFLLEERPKFDSLGCGCHNGIFYFGTKLYRDGKSYSSIITSDKKIYIKLDNDNKIKNDFGLNYKDDFFDESLDNIFSKEAIDKWCFGNTNKITLNSVFEKLVKQFKIYIYFEDDRKYSLLACKRIVGFFMPIWRAIARLFILADFGSAKSRLTQILHNTGFNSVSLGDWTLPYLKAIIESTRGETHIDDFETLPEEQKNATIRLVKIGYMKGFKAGKMSEGIKRKPEVNDLFNTTTLNNTEGLDFISNDRCITIRIPKISKKEYDKEPNFEEPIWKEIQNELYILGLKYASKVKETYETIKSDKIRGRDLFIIKPELTIAKLISKEVYKDIENFWVEEIEQRNTIDYETDWEFLSFKYIYKCLSTNSTNSTLSTHSTLSTTEYFSLLNDVIIPVGNEIYNDEEFKKKKRSMSIVIGNILSRNPIFKKRIVMGKTQYKANLEEFKGFLEAKKFLKTIVELVDSVDSRGEKTYRENEEKNPKITYEKIQDNPKKEHNIE